MPVLKFRVSWEEDDNVFRDIVIKPNHSFEAFQKAILTAYAFDDKHASDFYRSNDNWQRGKQLSSQVDENKPDAKVLSMRKTPLSAMITDPHQKFIFVYDPAKSWTFQIEMIAIIKEEDPKVTYPAVSRKEGMAPSQYGIRGTSARDSIIEVEEKYDLNSEDMDEEGFGNEGEEDSSESSEESYGSESGGDDY
jgi:hypothetical protein